MVTKVNSKQLNLIAAIDSETIQDSSIQIQDIDTTTENKSLITKIVAGQNVSISSTGVDIGTGVVTINSALIPTSIDILTSLLTIDGHNSGLDADLLDGFHASVFAKLESPSFIGIPVVPTASTGTNTTQIATTAFVKNSIKKQEGNVVIYPVGSSYIDNTIDLLQVDGSLLVNNGIRYTYSTGYGWRDLIGIIVDKGNKNTLPTFASFRDGLYLYSCPSTKMTELYLTFHIDHDYAMGTKLFPHVHWSTQNSNSGFVRWGFEVSVAKGHQQQAFPASTTIYVNQNNVGTYFHHVAEVSISDAIAATNVEPDSVILMRVFRDGINDTYNSAAFIIQADIHYQTDRINTKNKAPNFYA